MPRGSYVWRGFCPRTVLTKVRLTEGCVDVLTEKLDTTVETVTHCVQGLTYLLTESVRLMVRSRVGPTRDFGILEQLTMSVPLI